MSQRQQTMQNIFVIDTVTDLTLVCSYSFACIQCPTSDWIFSQQKYDFNKGHVTLWAVGGWTSVAEILNNV